MPFPDDLLFKISDIRLLFINFRNTNPIPNPRISFVFMHFYYVNSSAEQVGPVSVEELQKAGISRDTLVWKEGMSSWSPAGTVEELRSLFPAAIPVAEKKVLPPPIPTKISRPQLPEINRTKMVIAAIIVVVAALLLYFLVFSGEKQQQVSIAAASDSTDIDDADTSGNMEKNTGNETKIINLDSLGNNLKWDTIAGTDTTVAPAENVSFLPGFGGEATGTETKKNKTTSKKTTKSLKPARAEEETSDTRTHAPSPAPEAVNPVRLLSISGTFRKNLLFEAVMEGTIRNNSGSQLRDIVVEVRFLDANGQSAGTKRFTHNNPIAPSSSSPFKFRATAPKGTKSARYEIVSASSR